MPTCQVLKNMYFAKTIIFNNLNFDMLLFIIKLRLNNTDYKILSWGFISYLGDGLNLR